MSLFVNQEHQFPCKRLAVNVVFLQNSPKFFTRELFVFRGWNNKHKRFGILSKFLKFCWTVRIFVCGATASTKTAQSIMQLKFSYLAVFLFKAPGIHFSWKAKKEIPR